MGWILVLLDGSGGSTSPNDGAVNERMDVDWIDVLSSAAPLKPRKTG
jgi:hypothetical protein